MKKGKKVNVRPIFIYVGIAGGIFYAYYTQKDKKAEDKSFGKYFWYALAGGIGGSVIGTLAGGEKIIKITKK